MLMGFLMVFYGIQWHFNGLQWDFWWHFHQPKWPSNMAKSCCEGHRCHGRFDGLLEADERYFELHGATGRCCRGGRWACVAELFWGFQGGKNPGKMWEILGKPWETLRKTLKTYVKTLRKWRNPGKFGRFTTHGGFCRAKNPRWTSKNCGVDQ